MAETVKKTAFRITRMGQLVAQEASARLGVPFGIGFWLGRVRERAKTRKTGGA